MRPGLRQCLVGFVLILTLGVAWRAARERIRLESELPSLRRDEVRMSTLTTKVEASRATAEGSLAATNSAASIKHSTAAKKPIDEATLQKLRLKAASAGARFQYAAFLRLHGLTEDQIARFDDAMAEHQMTSQDIGAVASAEGLPTSDPGIAEMIAEEQRRLDSSLEELLGPDGPELLKDYDSIWQVRGVASRLTEALSDTATPISPEQEQQLVYLLRPLAGGQNPAGEPAPVDWDAAAVKAAAVLSAPQMAEFRDAAATVHRKEMFAQIWAIYRQWRKNGGGTP